MKHLLAVILFVLAATASWGALTIVPSGTNTGYYWYERSTWLGGSDTTTGFSYGDASGLLHTQTNYQYYGGSDRYWQQKDTYIQLDVSSLSGSQIASARIHFYLTANSAIETFLKHVDTQTVVATGDAGQKLVGATNVASTTSFVAGWNSIDVTTHIQSDVDKGYDYAAFSIPKFSQSQDENRLMSFYGASTTQLVGGISAKPYLEVTLIPEPSIPMLMAVSGAFTLILRRRKHQHGC